MWNMWNTYSNHTVIHLNLQIYKLHILKIRNVFNYIYKWNCKYIYFRRTMNFFWKIMWLYTILLALIKTRVYSRFIHLEALKLDAKCCICLKYTWATEISGSQLDPPARKISTFLNTFKYLCFIGNFLPRVVIACY